MRLPVLWVGLLFWQSAVADNECERLPLSILLTNDDGIATVGIQEMHRALVDAGHIVKRIAPDRNYSGTGTSLTLSEVVVEDRSSEEFSNVYAVSGTPATSVILGATAIYQPGEPLDFMVAGINDSPNVGAGTTASGTVGAILTGLNMLYPAVPGIAISTSAATKDRQSPQHRQHFANVASYVARTITVIACNYPSLLSTKQSLNINYPPLDPDKIRGVRLAEQGYLASRWLGFVANKDGRYNIQVLGEPVAASEAADTMLFERGYITIVPIDGLYAAMPQFEIEQILMVEP